MRRRAVADTIAHTRSAMAHATLSAMNVWCRKGLWALGMWLLTAAASQAESQLVPDFAEVRAAHASSVARLVDRNGHPWILDLGLAKVKRIGDPAYVKGVVMGTPYYMPPEQALGDMEKVDHLSDIYSLGATLYTLLTGEPPFHAVTLTGILNLVTTKDPVPPRKRNPEIPVPVEAIIQKAMQKAKEKRYSSAGELADDLERFLRAAG